MDPVVTIHSFLLGQSLVKTFLCFLKGLLLMKRQKYTPRFSQGFRWVMCTFTGSLPCLVPLWLLHFFGLSLCGEDETGSQRGHGPFSDSLLGVPYCVKDVVKERLHLLKEESGGTHSQLPQHQHLKERVNCPISY